MLVSEKRRAIRVRFFYCASVNTLRTPYRGLSQKAPFLPAWWGLVSHQQIDEHKARRYARLGVINLETR